MAGIYRSRNVYLDMYEERALILERLGRHEQALSIYVVVMKDKEKAKQYCSRVYSKNDRNRKEVYTVLMRMLLNPPTSIMPGIALDEDKNATEPDLAEAIKLLHDYAPNIEPSRVSLLCITYIANLRNNIAECRQKIFITLFLFFRRFHVFRTK